MLTTNVFAQNKIVDSLELCLKNAKHDSTRLRLHLSLCIACDLNDNLKYGEPGVKTAENLIKNTSDQELKRKYSKQKAEIFAIMAVYYERTEKSGSKNHFNYLEKTLASYKEAKDTSGITNTIVSFADYYLRDGNIIRQLEELQKGLTMWENANYKKGIARFIKEIGFLYADQGDTARAKDYLEKGLLIEKEIGDKSRISRGYYLMGLLYARLKYYDKAIYYYYKAIERYGSLKEINTLPEIYLSLGEAYQAKQQFKEALKVYNEGYVLADEANDSRIKFFITNALGSVDAQLGNYTKAIEQHQKNYDIALKIPDNYLALWLASSSLAKDYYEINDLKNSKTYSDKALITITASGAASDIMIAEKMAYRIDSASNNYKEAHLHYLKYIKLRDQLSGEDVKKAAIREKFQNELEKQKQRAKAEQQQKDLINEKENQNKNNIITAISLGLIIVLILAILIFRGYRQKQKINKELLYKNELIENQKKLVEEQKQLVDDKQKEILDSINYASRIQKALLPSDKYLEKHIKKN
ncbi:MAG: tetratricopeptide repeat protein [Bacteroidia bacterium]|nr:tetratricopeptide repeat protein [Bacteroidia bacterium]